VSRWLVRWRLALRIARRDALKHRGRTILVLAMVGLPVLAVVAADTFFRTSDVTAVEKLDTTLGAADAQLIGHSRDERVYAEPDTGLVWETGTVPADPEWSADEVAAALPTGSRVVEVVEGRTTYFTGIGRADVAAVARDNADPMVGDSLRVDEGRLPLDDGELAVSRGIADRGFAVGDRLELTSEAVPARIVGIVHPPAGASDPFVVLPLSSADLLSNPRSRFLATVPGSLDWPAVQALNAEGLVVLSRDVAADPPPSSEWLPPDITSDPFSVDRTGMAVMALVVASVVLEIVLLAGPAFAVGVRRQRRDLALIAATGGSPGDLRRIVLASGVVLGGGAAMVGAVLGIGVAAVAVPVVQRWTDRGLGPFELPLVDVAVTVAVGLLAGLAAAWFPARQAARTDVVETLAGRRGQVRTSWRSPVVGLLLAGGGLALVVIGARGAELGVAAGAAVLIVGLVVAAPWLVGLLAPLARRLPVSGRLAVRDATRNRGRTAPALAAVMATVAGVTALSIGSASDSAQAQRDYLPMAPVGSVTITAPDLGAGTWAEVEQVLHDQDRDRPVHRIQGLAWTGETADAMEIRRPDCAGTVDECRWWMQQSAVIGSGFGEIAVLGPDAARDLVRGAFADQAARALAGGRAVVFGGADALGGDGEVTLAAVHYEVTQDQAVGSVTATVDLPAQAVDVPSDGVVVLPATVLVPPGLADRLPAEVRTMSLVAGGPDDPVTPEQEQQLREAVGVLAGVAGITVERGWQDDLAIARYVLFGLGALLVLIATLTATGLALTDARPDFATLAAVGADPRTRRLTAMGSAAVVGGGGALLGVLVGLAPGIAIAYPLTRDSGWGVAGQALVEIPWLLLAGVGVAVPLLAVAITGLFVRAKLPMYQRMA
jgi:putative ABC transport system permease protein